MSDGDDKNVVQFGELQRRRDARNKAMVVGQGTSPTTPQAPMSGVLSDTLRDFVRAAVTKGPDGEADDSSKDLLGMSTVIGTMGLRDVLGKLVERNESKIRGYKTLVESYEDDELRGWLDNPKESDLKTKPYFFHALIDEANRRFLYNKIMDTPSSSE